MFKIREKNVFPIIFLGGILLMAGFLFVFNPTPSVRAQNDNMDAIAIRVYPNPKHYSALRWYKEKGFEGSPQSLTVDGYEAVRDGRTVYVNASNAAGGILYTNIYLISFNQAAAGATSDIFSNILKNWKYNTNANTFGQCLENNTLRCITDADCPLGDICLGIKARLIRDTKRMADLADISESLGEYFGKKSSYPSLLSGTYLPSKTMSVWPSWESAFGVDLGIPVSVDPVNKLGACPGYNQKTCWNEVSKRYADDFPDLPDNSLTYEYYSDANGSFFTLCTIYESGLGISGTIYAPLGDCPEVCLDFDGDGYGFPGSVLCAAASPLYDCDDTNSAILFGTPEICNGGLDEDCDGFADCSDSECVTASACIMPGSCNFNGICEPSLGETCSSCAADFCCGPPPCGDGICDEATECSLCYGPGLDCRCGNGGAPECAEQCDDGNTVSGDGCSSTCTLEGAGCSDVDGDRYIPGATPVSSCGNVCGPSNNQSCIGNSDCDDTLATGLAINPAAVEICDGIDNDCNALTPDGLGSVTPLNTIQAGVCNGSERSCTNGIWIDDYASVSGYVSPESPCDGVADNDCDGDSDAVDSDCTGFCSNASEANHVGASPGCNQCGNVSDDDGNQTSPLFPTVAADWIAAGFGAMIDVCDPACGPGISLIDLDRYENGSETLCDALDNDCNGVIDDAAAPLCPLQAGVCLGAVQICAGLSGWQACSAAEYGPFYEVIETVCDGKDNNCNGSIDDSLVAPLNDNQNGVCALSTKTCSGIGGWTNDYSTVPFNEWPIEISCDGKDNNCNGLVDEPCSNTCTFTATLPCTLN